MRLSDIVSFRRDLLFQGAVQVGWFETDPERSIKAAEHFVFHGPEYHGSAKGDFGDDDAYRLVDTASFARTILNHVGTKGQKDDPIILAVAGYGTGKSHFALTMARLLSEPSGEVSKRIVSNLTGADRRIGLEADKLLQNIDQPYLILAINGMQDFDLSGEITRQVFQRLAEKGIDTRPLEELRPRFQKAQKFTESFFQNLREEFAHAFGARCTKEEIIERLKQQDEEAFIAVNRIFKQKMGDSLRAVGHESLQGFLKVVKQKYCGLGKPFGGMIIFFDEFGRYLEFAVRKPHIAGAGGLQQLFEAVQDNSDSILLLCFIQSELKAYASRIAPENRQALERYISRFDSAKKLRLSTNLETIFANLIEKKDPKSIQFHIDYIVKTQKPTLLVSKLNEWFPDMRNYALWNDVERFQQVIQKGCWPLHPCTTWLLYRLSAVGKSLQNRSAMFFLDDVFQRCASEDIDLRGWRIPPVALCTEDMIHEFLESERYAHQGKVAGAYENVLAKYGHELPPVQQKQLKAVLLASKIGLKANNQQECHKALALLAGSLVEVTAAEIDKLVKEKGVLRWNRTSSQYDIVGDGVSMREFLEFLELKVNRIGSEKYSQIFSQNMKQWFGMDLLKTDFGASKNISSAEWHFSITFSNVSAVGNHIKSALADWQKALSVDEPRGQLIYCYVGPESDLRRVRDSITQALDKSAQQMGISLSEGAPIAVLLLHDQNGSLGKQLAEFWVLHEQLEESDGNKYSNFIAEHQSELSKQILHQFRNLEKAQDFVFACDKRISAKDIQSTLNSLFDSIYPELIAFPFDRFHSARVNAAKDCRLFTTELFTGNLNQSWISARKSQQKSRAVNLLQKTWQVFEADGNIRARPGDLKVRRIIDAMDSLLKDKYRGNLGDMVRTLCRPPYGCNIASVGLILGIYVAARKDRLRFRRRDEAVHIENWLAGAFKGDLLSLSALDETSLDLIADDPMQQWQALLNEWDVEKTYQGQIDFLQKSQQLNKEELVPDSLYYRWELLQKRALDAQKAIDDWKKTIFEQEKLIEKATERGEAGRLAQCAAALTKLFDDMKRNEHNWIPQQTDIVSKLLSGARENTKKYFPEWIQRQVVTDPTELGEFKRKMSQLRQTLIALEMAEEAKLAQMRLNSAAAEMDRLIQVKASVAQARTFVQSHRIFDGKRVNEIAGCLEAIPDLKNNLQEAVGTLELPQINETISSLNSLEDQCREQLNAYESRVKDVCNGQLNSHSQINGTKAKVLSLTPLYDNMNAETKLFQHMLNFLELLEQHCKRMSSFEMSDDELRRTCEELLQHAKEVAGENGQLPWDVEKTYASLVREVHSKRKDYASDWMRKNVPDVEEIGQMDVSLVQRLRIILQSPPALLNGDQRKKVGATINACINRLDAMEVEGLLVRFKDLSKEAQSEFLKRIQQFVA